MTNRQNSSAPAQSFWASRVASRFVLVIGLLTAAASLPALAGTIGVTSTGASTPTSCSLAQAIYSANLANNPSNTTPLGATTVSPLSRSAATAIGIGSCSGASAGANTLQLPTAASIVFASDTPDNFWYGPNALPPIASNITIEGNGATLSIAIGTSLRLRFFYVGANPQSAATPGYNTPGAGSLTLKNITLTGGQQRGGGAFRGGGGAGMGGAIFNQGSLALQGVTLNNNQAIGGASGLFDLSVSGAGMGADSDGSRAGMGGLLPLGTSEAGGNGSVATGVGGAGGGVPNGLGGFGGDAGVVPGSSSGNGGGGGASTRLNDKTTPGGGGSGFGGGPGGAAQFLGIPLLNYGGTFGEGGRDGSGGGVGGGGGSSGGSFSGGGGGFGGGGGAGNDGARFGGRGGFGGGGSSPDGASGYGGGIGFRIVASSGGGGGAGMGGAIFNHAGSVSIVNTSLTGNAAIGGSTGIAVLSGAGGSGFGGAIFNLNGALQIAFSTIAGNSVAGGAGGTSTGYGSGAAFGGAVFSLAYNGAAVTGSSSATVTLQNSILANSTGGVDLAVDQPATVIGGLNNAAVAATGAIGTNLVMTTVVGGAASLPTFNTSNPSLGPLGNNGGPTATMALLAGSPAIDAATGGTLPPTDQRGLARPFGAAPDVGAFEFGAVGAAPAITSTAPPNGGVGAVYSHIYTATGAPAPTFALQTGSFPPGLNLTGALLSGRPSQTGTFTGTVRASNAGGSNDQAFSITIAVAAPGAPTLSALTAASGAATAVFAAPSSNGGTSIIDYTVSCSPGPLTATASNSPIAVTGLTNGTPYQCTVRARNSVGSSAASNVLSVTPAVSFPPNCQFPAGYSTPGGSSAWVVATDSVQEGSCSLRSPVGLSDSSNARIQTTANFSAGNVSFFARVSSEAGFDCFRFLVDGVRQNIGSCAAQPGNPGISGEFGWQLISVPITAGTRTLTWSYEKDESDFAGSDAAWIDLVTLPPTAVADLIFANGFQ